MTTYVTFGFDHAHAIAGRTFDKDCVAVFPSETAAEGRAKAFEVFGDRFCFEYFNKQPDLSFFPRGLIWVFGGATVANNNGLPRVFVTQELPISYRKTESYGEVFFLTGKEPAQHTGSLRNAEIFAGMAERMADYRPGTDYLLPSGSPISIGLGFLLAWQKGPRVRVLQWQSRDAKYNEYVLDVEFLTAGLKS